MISAWWLTIPVTVSVILLAMVLEKQTDYQQGYRKGKYDQRNIDMAICKDLRKQLEELNRSLSKTELRWERRRH